MVHEIIHYTTSLLENHGSNAQLSLPGVLGINICAYTPCPNQIANFGETTSSRTSLEFLLLTIHVQLVKPVKNVSNKFLLCFELIVYSGSNQFSASRDRNLVSFCLGMENSSHFTVALSDCY